MLFFANFSIFSQTVNGQRLTELDTQYLQVSLNYSEIFSLKLNLNIDYGQDQKLDKNNYLLDVNGKKRQFYSFVDASNFLFKHGFEYVDVKTIRNENPSSDAYIYTFKKRSVK
jgi:hypothetical protein